MTAPTAVDRRVAIAHRLGGKARIRAIEAVDGDWSGHCMWHWDDDVVPTTYPTGDAALVAALPHVLIEHPEWLTAAERRLLHGPDTTPQLRELTTAAAVVAEIHQSAIAAHCAGEPQPRIGVRVLADWYTALGNTLGIPVAQVDAEYGPRGDGLCPSCPTDLDTDTRGWLRCPECGWTNDPSEFLRLHGLVDDARQELDQWTPVLDIARELAHMHDDPYVCLGPRTHELIVALCRAVGAAGPPRPVPPPTDPQKGGASQ